MDYRCLLIVLAVVLFIRVTSHNEVVVDDTFDKLYSINIIDEHEVVLVNDCDTVRLFLENAYALSDQNGIYIKK